ncbi:MAG: hypothetical protein II605_04390, partial [Paludibacteraceae bacterium]|nr:hypothetical protein [Paludibacteraceae bacterium]
KYDVTLVAQWEDVSKVAVIVETNVKYESLADAVAAATDGQTIQLLQNNNVTAQVEVAGKAITLDLAGYKIEYTGTSTLPSGVILVHNGASLTIDDSSDPDAGSIVSGADAYAAIALTKAGDDAANPAILVINGGIFTGDYYAITGNGSRHNTQITINAGTFSGAHANDNSAIYHPQQGTLIINGGTFTGYSAAIELRAGTLEINDGTFTATATEYSCNPSGSGTTTVGAAIAIAQHNTQKDIAVTINGGTFEGVKAINEANPQGNPAPAVAMSVTDGDFTGEVSTVDVHEFISGGTYDAPVANENCAYGYVPAPEVTPGVYTVMPKDGVEIIGVVVTGNTTGTVSGLYKGDASVNLNSKKIDSGKYIYVTLKEGYTFEETDVLIVDVNSKASIGTKALEITTGVGNIDGDVWTSIAFDDYATGDNIISLEGIAANQTSIGLKRSDNQNAKINGIRVLRPMKPMLTAITIDGRDGVIDEANKTVAVQIPYEANLAALTVVPTIVWNEAAATNSIVVNDGAAWTLGDNTYKLTDKDGDYTVYTITLTRDVQKHAVKFYDGETLLETVEVEDGESIDAGDVPADPTKEDYVFQGWAETADGAVVDVTSFAISATKNFYAKWAAETGVIKLLDGEGNVNTTDFITAVTAGTVNFDAADHNCVTFGSTASTVINQSGANKYIVYNARTNQTKIKFVLYNTNSNAQQLVLQKIAEGETAIAEGNEITIDVPSKERFETPYYTYNSDVNRTMYVFTKNTNIKVLQVKVVDDGAPVKQAGEAGYSLNLNVGRVFAPANTGVVYDGLTMETGSNYKVLNSTEFQTLKNISFSVASPVLLKVTTNAAKYYVSQDPNEDGTTATAITAAGTEEISLSTTGTWYLVPSSTSNVKFTNIAFELPKAEKPVIETQPATNHTFNPGDMTATVVVTEPTDGGTLSYQWYNADGDVEVVGATEATLTTTTEGTYYVIITNSLAGHQDNSTKSDEAELGYRVTNDATLSALSYGTPATAITLEDGVYTYYVELAKGTTDVPALAATATMNGYATVTISNAAEFESYAASSTVTVKSEDMTVTNVYTVNFAVKHDLPQVDVTESTVWDMNNVSASEINLASMTPSKQNVLLLLANIEGVNNNASFNSQALMFEGQRIGRTENNVKYVSGQYVQFNVTVPGMVSVTFASNGSAQRTILINGKQCSRTTNDGTYIKYDVAVEPGSVEIEDVQGYVRISKIEFKAEASHTRSGLNPSYLGTLCWTNNAILGGATLYEFAGKDENNKLVFDEVAENRLEAGKPYIFMPENGNTEIKLYNTDNDAALTVDQAPVNNMYGTIEGKTLVPGEDDNMYYFSANHIWAVKDYSVNIVVPAYFCYIDYPAVLAAAPAPAPAPGRRRVTMGVNGTNTATGVDAIETSEQPMKLLINGQIFILRGEQMYDATGRLVK